MTLWLPEKVWCKPQNGLLASNSPIFKNGGKSPLCLFSYVWPKFKCLQFICPWKGSFIKINIVLRTRVQKWKYLELLLENQKELLKVVSFVKNRQDIKKMTQQNYNNCLTKNFFAISYLQYHVYCSC